MPLTYEYFYTPDWYSYAPDWPFGERSVCTRNLCGSRCRPDKCSMIHVYDEYWNPTRSGLLYARYVHLHNAYKHLLWHDV